MANYLNVEITLTLYSYKLIMKSISDCLFVSVEYLREEVVVLLAAQFITLFNQTALEVQ